MSVVTNQIINNFYDLYRENEIVFTKDIMRSLRVDPRQVYIKCAGAQWPCIINSSSLTTAKIIIGTSGGAYKMVSKKEVPPVSLRYCFIEQDNQPLNFFIMGHVTNITPYMSSSDLAVVTITFTSRPPDDLIFKIGSLIDANQSFTKRKEERITINELVQRKIGLEKRESIVSIDNIIRRCIIWDISFSGAQIIVSGQEAQLKGKMAILRFLFIEPSEVIDVNGIIVAVHTVDNRPGILSISLKFDENTVPLAYKLRINDYLTLNRKSFLEKNSKKEEDEKSESENKTEKTEGKENKGEEAATETPENSTSEEKTDSTEAKPQENSENTNPSDEISDSAKENSEETKAEESTEEKKADE